MKLVSSAQMSEIDRISQEAYSIPGSILMENAGVKACYAINRCIFHDQPPAGLLVFIAGRGNNGGDAFVMARQYYNLGCTSISIILAAGEPVEGSDPFINLTICRKLDIPVIDIEKDHHYAIDLIKNAEWIFDGIAGTGLKGELKSGLYKPIEAINRSDAKVIAIDVPSGIGDEFEKGFLCVNADYTLTIGLPKLCLYMPLTRMFCGEIFVVDPGFPRMLTEDPAIPGNLLDECCLAALNPPIASDTYKNKRGHLLVFAGSMGTTGAAWLASHAAARSRCGLVTLAIDQSVYHAIASDYHSVMIRQWIPGTIIGDIEKFDALLIGPGWGKSLEKQEFLKYAVSLEKPVVVDADALSMLPSILSSLKNGFNNKAVLTPHPGEFSALTGISRDILAQSPLSHVLAASSRYNAVIVLKGHITFIASPDGKFFLLDGLNPALATAGSGDVLAGLIAGFLSQGMTVFEAAQKGVLVHSIIGKIMFNEKGWFIAGDMIEKISLILK